MAKGDSDISKITSDIRLVKLFRDFIVKERNTIIKSLGDVIGDKSNDLEKIDKALGLLLETFNKSLQQEVGTKENPIFVKEIAPQKQNSKVPEVKFPKKIDVKKPDWYEEFNYKALDSIVEGIKEVLNEHTKVDSPLAVRLVDKDAQTFYTAIAQAISSANFPAFRDSAGNAQKALVDADGHAQVDVLTSALPSGAATEATLATLATQTTLASLLTTANSILAGGTQYTLRLDDVGGGVTYIGKATPGTATNAAAWQIKKLDESASPDMVITWAAGVTTFSQVWDNRAGLSYS